MNHALRTTASTPIDWELDRLMDFEYGLIENPYPLYIRMRIEAPVMLHRGIIHVTPYRLVEAVIRERGLFSNLRGGERVGRRADQLADPEDRAHLVEVADFMDRFLVSLDAPEHPRLRGLIHRAFTQRRVAQLASSIQRITEELISAAQPKGWIDVVSELAVQLPLYVIAAMIGANREDTDRIRRWVTTLSVFATTDYSNYRGAHTALVEFRSYVAALIASRAADPQTDILAALLLPDENGDRLSSPEIESTIMVLLFGGNESTTNLIGNGLFSLFRNPEQLAALRANPSLIRPAIEECIRWETSVQNVHRTAKVDVELEGVSIPAGTTLRLILGSANRDPQQFGEPDRFDIRRTGPRNLGFGVGPHHCLGAALARAELSSAIGTLIFRFPNLRILEPPRWRASQAMRGLEGLRLGLG